MSTHDSTAPRGVSPRSVFGYVALIVMAVAGFQLVRRAGVGLSAPAPSTSVRFGTAADTHSPDVLLHVLLAMVVVIVAARVVGSAFKWIKQPAVIGETIAGIMLGPSLLGHVAPHASAFVLPPSVAPFLGIISQVGVIIFMFLVGLELDTELLRHRTHSSVAVSHASIIAPFLLGSALALWLYPRISTHDVPFTYFALFLGVSMSVTAFPVLARILTDQRMHKTRLGVISLTCAAVDDVTAWCLLAFVVSVVHARAGSALVTVAMTGAYVLVMLVAVRPLAMRFVAWTERQERIGAGAMTVVCVALLLSALVTEAIGIHALFGAFLVGAIVPQHSKLAQAMIARLEDFVVVLFLPAFFAFTGMRTQIGLLSGATQWLLCGLIVTVACLGKFGGSFIAARLTGLSWRDAASVGVLMNTRGLMELIALNIGFDLHVISPTAFAMLVIMALVTTFLTTPVLHWLAPQDMLSRAPASTSPTAVLH